MAEWVGFEPTDPKGQQISSHAKYNDHERKWWKLSEDNGTSKPFERAVFLVALSQKPWKEKGFELLPKTA